MIIFSKYENPYYRHFASSFILFYYYSTVWFCFCFSSIAKHIICIIFLYYSHKERKVQLHFVIHTYCGSVVCILCIVMYVHWCTSVNVYCILSVSCHFASTVFPTDSRDVKNFPASHSDAIFGRCTYIRVSTIAKCANCE